MIIFINEIELSFRKIKMNNQQDNNSDEKLEELLAREKEMEDHMNDLKRKYEEQKQYIRALKESVALRNVVLNVFKDFDPNSLEDDDQNDRDKEKNQND